MKMIFTLYGLAFLMLRVGAGEKLLFLPKQESSSLSESMISAKIQ